MLLFPDKPIFYSKSTSHEVCDLYVMVVDIAIDFANENAALYTGEEINGTNLILFVLHFSITLESPIR